MFREKLKITYLAKPATTTVVEGFDGIEEKKLCCLYDSNLERPNFLPKEAVFFPLEGQDRCKTRKVKEKVEDFLIEHRFGPDSAIIAVGGGSVTDLAGFVAATYCRGIALYLMPTTLLAMCDAAIGGKNGINLGGFKNYSGTIYHPKKIFIDFSYLDTLSKNEIAAGEIEMLKLEIAVKKIEEKDRKKRVFSAIAIKQETIIDGKRDLLNFGHTIGHALEVYCLLSHGKAVAFGIIAESYLSVLLGHLDINIYTEIKEAVDAIYPDLVLVKPLDENTLLELMKQDKKNRADSIHVVCIQHWAKPLCFSSVAVEETLLLEALRKLYDCYFH